MLPLSDVGGQANGLLASKLTSLLCKDVSSEKSSKMSQNHLSIVFVTLIESKGRKPSSFLRPFEVLKGNSSSRGELMCQRG